MVRGDIERARMEEARDTVMQEENSELSADGEGDVCASPQRSQGTSEVRKRWNDTKKNSERSIQQRGKKMEHVS